MSLKSTPLPGGMISADNNSNIMLLLNTAPSRSRSASRIRKAHPSNSLKPEPYHESTKADQDMRPPDLLLCCESGTSQHVDMGAEIKAIYSTFMDYLSLCERDIAVSLLLSSSVDFKTSRSAISFVPGLKRLLSRFGENKKMTGSGAVHNTGPVGRVELESHLFLENQRWEARRLLTTAEISLERTGPSGAAELKIKFVADIGKLMNETERKIAEMQ